MVAFVILVIILNGFMYGLAVYLEYELRTRIKNEASRMLKDIAGYFEGMTYKATSEFDIKAVFDSKKCVNVTVGTSTVTLCEFEYSDPISQTILDSDGDGVADFYDPYDGSNPSFKSNPRAVAGWLTVYPASSGSGCTVDSPGGSPGTVNFQCVKAVAGTNIFSSVTVSKIIDDYGRELGKAFGITVWYFEPKTDKYVSIKSVVFKEKI